jgi:hypothetical protein
MAEGPSLNETISPFERLLVALARAEIDFAVVGGVAVCLNGYVRTTEDVDILVDESPVNVGRLLEVLEAFGEGHARELAVSDFAPAEGAIRIVEEFPLDVFTRMRGHSLQDLRPRLRRFATFGVSISYLDPTALIELKRGSWREKDQIDVAAMGRVLSWEEAGRTGPAPFE